ncbi:NnrU family protein [Stappia sp. GBMRC 2046]|uniref:NnrU family protein n=1 Tax=Stappia sediminis TaxID=2692190 RepID=A0A7X3S861_9HYPH|nr:NnrU family protein [Stappia sediminis]MXN65533.1 NnrU family protein [Stappia sediminis]
MTSFIAAIIAFFAAHSIPAIKPVRSALVGAMGLRGYLATYSVLSLALLAWVIWAALNAPYVELWGQPQWAWHPALLLASLGILSATFGLVRPNPLSISLNSATFDPTRPGLTAYLRHPVLTGFLLWGIGHLLINGDVVLVALFGAMTLFAAIGPAIVNRRIIRRMGTEKRDHLIGKIANARRTRPFLSLFGMWDIAGIVAGLAAIAALLGGLHLLLFGADPLAGA